MINEEEIRKEVYGRHHDIHVTASHMTPTGRRRSVPVYQTTISNSFLRENRRVQGHSVADVEEKVRKQLTRWNDLEIKTRLGGVIRDLQAEHKAIDQILGQALGNDCRVDWLARIDKSEFKPFEWKNAEPQKPTEPQAAFFEFLFPSWRRERERLWSNLQNDWQTSLTKWEADREIATQNHMEQLADFEAKKLAANNALLDFQRRLDDGDSEAIVENIRETLEESQYPDSFPRHYEIALDYATKTVVVDVALPEQKIIPDTIEVKYSGNDFKRKKMKSSEHDDLYDTAIKKCVLRTIHEVFQTSKEDHVTSVVLNGWVTSTDEATGNETTSCIVSVSVERTRFQSINLRKVDPTKCIAGLKGLIAGPLSSLAPVRPILQLKTEDKRFIESKDVLAEYNSTTNLAEIPWEDFEQLVRELFGKMFSSEGSEVRVTQASRDGGVDAVAFDPDPIRGGKFVIQAKRYTNVVGVSAVRDLYGTMINEGAARGILVTTSHFGADSREFAKDKPITLVDGQNLVYLLEKHGKKVRIDIEAARRNRA